MRADDVSSNICQDLLKDECCMETRYAVMVNWKMNKKQPKEQQAEDALTNRGDSKRYKSMLRSQGN